MSVPKPIHYDRESLRDENGGILCQSVESEWPPAGGARHGYHQLFSIPAAKSTFFHAVSEEETRQDSDHSPLSTYAGTVSSWGGRAR